MAQSDVQERDFTQINVFCGVTCTVALTITNLVLKVNKKEILQIQGSFPLLLLRMIKISLKVLKILSLFSDVKIIL